MNMKPISNFKLGQLVLLKPKTPNAVEIINRYGDEWIVKLIPKSGTFTSIIPANKPDDDSPWPMVRRIKMKNEVYFDFELLT